MPLLAEGGFSPGSVKDGEEGGIPVNARIRPIIWNSKTCIYLIKGSSEKESYIACHTLADVQKCIQEMVVRVAPAIGVAAAALAVLAARKIVDDLNSKEKSFLLLN